ncbi:hypothetical protein ACXYTP_00100 [Tsukamurella ocularis]|uniref:hypothetical protein n=1 Tax=Tsukamurella ocularis TaxID=1970234 RepID=UPI0039EF6264
MVEFNYDYAGMGQWLRGPEATAMTRDAGERAKAIYQSVVARRTGQLAESATVSMSRGRNGRPVATLTVGGTSAPYGLAHEFGADGGVQAAHHDLLVTLGMLR